MKLWIVYVIAKSKTRIKHVPLSFYNANKIDYRSLPSFKNGKGPCQSLKGEVQIAINVKLKFRFICLQIDTVMLPKTEFPWNLQFPFTVIKNLYTGEKKIKWNIMY